VAQTCVELEFREMTSVRDNSGSLASVVDHAYVTRYCSVVCWVVVGVCRCSAPDSQLEVYLRLFRLRIGCRVHELAFDAQTADHLQASTAKSSTALGVAKAPPMPFKC
jgi:hypothetical protein